MNNLISFRSVLSAVNKLKDRNNILKPSLAICCQIIQLRPHKSNNVSNVNLGIDLSSQDQSNIVKFLQSYLSCSNNDAESLYNNHYEFLINNHTNLCERIEFLGKLGIFKSTVVEHFWILFFSREELNSRFNLLKEWEFTNPNNGVDILKLPMMRLIKYTKQTKSESKFLDSMNRITYFSSNIQCHEKRASELFMKYQFMMTIKVESLKNILSLVKDQGVLTEDLLSDLWVFRYSLSFIQNRIKQLDEIGAKHKCEVIKPWMLRCTDVILNRYFEIKEENIAALGAYSNLKDLISNELGLPAAQIEEMFFKHPPLAKISYAKAKEMIEFLKSEGFSSTMIYQVPRVLCHKQATLVARMVELKKVSPNLINLHNLCRNKKDYVSFLKKMST